MTDPGGPSTLGGRLLEARLLTATRVQRTLSQGAMAELVAKELGRGLWQQQWSTYEAGTAEPPLDVLRAAGKLSGLDPGYIAFGQARAVQPAAATELAEVLATARPMPQPRSPGAKVGRRKGRGRH